MLRRFPICALLLLVARIASAQGPAPSPLTAPLAAATPAPEATPSIFPSPAPELTRADLEPFLDALLNSQIENRDIAGAVVSVVRDGQVILAKGYGFADFEQRKPATGEGTLFRPGSISKLFNAVAVMQLVEQGTLDLDKDVREYLDFEIPRSFAEPVTLRRILTHTAGYEESIKNLFASPNEPIPPLREYLIAHAPAQIYRPGTVPAYSNWAIALSGYIVERLSRQPFDRYVDEHILAPLQMTSSTFTQPLPAAFETRMSNGYTIPSAKPKPFEICAPVPAGALSTTAMDMTRFMLALLNGGSLDGTTILRPESLDAMQSRVFELHSNLHAMGLGFMEYSQHGHTMWGHGGDTLLFHSDMFLIPDARVGVFVSYNSGGNRPGSGRGELQRAFMRRYFPETETPPLPVQDTIEHGRKVSGVYENSRKSQTNRLRIMALVGQTSVTSDKAGVLTIEDAKNLRGQPKRWREVAPYVYEEINGPDRVAFRRDENGNVVDMLPNMPISIGQRASGLQSKALLIPLVGGSTAFIQLTLLLSPFAAIIRKRYGRALLPDSRTRLWFVLSRLVCLLLVGMLVAFALPFAWVNNDVAYLGDKINPWLRTSQVLGWLGAAGLLVLAIATLRFWRTAGIRWWTRVHSTLLLFAGVVFVWFAWQWHMLSPSLKF